MDWAGLAGGVVYPALLNTKNIAWPDGVAPGKMLERKHDIDLLHLQCNRTTQFLKNDWRMMFLTSVQVSEINVDCEGSCTGTATSLAHFCFCYHRILPKFMHQR